MLFKTAISILRKYVYIYICIVFIKINTYILCIYTSATFFEASGANTKPHIVVVCFSSFEFWEVSQQRLNDPGLDVD